MAPSHVVDLSCVCSDGSHHKLIHNINYQGTTSPLLMTVSNVGPKLTVVVVVRLVCIRSVRAVVTRCRHPATVTR
jgi:hypothetical protein